MDRFKQRARQLRTLQTNAEAKLWYALRNRRLARWKFRRQYEIEGYVVDFVTIEGKLVVEVDGAMHSTSIELARDAKRTKALEACGFFVLRVTNIDVYENLSGILEEIDRTLRPP
jgi:very-short-patch-repair endonuclease